LPKVYGLSKIRNYESGTLEIPQKEKDITIRNVDAKAYNEFVAYCQLNNRLVSEVVNVLLAQIIPEMEINQIIIGELQENPLDLLVISSLKKLEIKVDDLEQLNDEKIVFHRIKELTFSEKISNDLFISSVIAIYNCEEISLPNDLSNLLVASRVRKYP
jgi:hypothetical protein